MNRRLFISGIIMYLFSQNICASEQFPDILIYNGKEYEIGIYPMETYFKINPNERPGIRGINSALERGYRAKFEIINNELILVDIEITEYPKFDWKSVFSRYFNNNKIKVNTFTGRINIFNGKETGVYMAFTPIYENYIILNINEGNYIDEYNIDCFEYLESIIQLYQEESYEYKYFSKLLEELYKINE
jgi:hypothetical protein